MNAPAPARAAKPCQELKSEITKKIAANGVKSYTLDIVAKDQDAAEKFVGICDGGTRKIVCKRGEAVGTETKSADVKKS